jgi:hypothetical protein
MKGIIFNHLEEFVSLKLGQQEWQKLCEELPLKTHERFIVNQTYPDSDLEAIVKEVSKKLNLELSIMWKSVGKFSVGLLISKYPQIIAPYHSLKALLNHINTMHFDSVRKLFTQTELPYLSKEPRSTDSLFVLRYVSQRKMCDYLEGALNAAADYYKENIIIIQSSCMHRGSNVCEFEVKF